MTAGDAEAALEDEDAREAGHDHRHHHRRKLGHVDAVRPQRQGHRAFLQVTEARRIADDLAPDRLAVIGQRHELHQQPGAVSVVELPQRMQRFVVGQRLALTNQVRLGAFPQDGQEQVVHAREVVVHECGLDARLRRHPPRGRSGVALLEHDLGGRSDQRLPCRGVPSRWSCAVIWALTVRRADC